MSQIPVSSSAAGNYPPTTTMGAAQPPDPYHKVPLSGATNFTSEPQEMPLPTSMPSVQLSLAANDPPAIRPQYAYAPSSNPVPPQLASVSVSSSEAAALSVPRYVDSNPRPSKSPRTTTDGHQSMPSSSGSMPQNEGAVGEYRYGNGSGGSSGGGGGGGGGSYPESGTQPGGGEVAGSYTTSEQQTQPPRDYYPPSSSWTTTAGEPSSTVAYTNGGEARPYSFPERNGSGGGGGGGGGAPAPVIPKIEPGSHGAAPVAAPGSAAVYGASGLSHYSWNTS